MNLKCWTSSSNGSSMVSVGNGFGSGTIDEAWPTCECYKLPYELTLSAAVLIAVCCCLTSLTIFADENQPAIERAAQVRLIRGLTQNFTVHATASGKATPNPNPNSTPTVGGPSGGAADSGRDHLDSSPR